MENLGKRNLFCKLVLVACFSLVTSACAMFGGKSELEDPGFRQKVTPAQQAVPLPVEIAKDIERISEDGLLVYSDNPSYSKAFDQFSQNFKNVNGQQVDANGNKIENQNVPSEGELAINSNVTAEEAGAEGVLDENQIYVKEENGPLATSLRKKKNGPLNFKSAMNGSGLAPLTGGKTVNYIVRLGDTLMKIAFEKYANYLRWKDIYKINKNKMKSPEKMQVGTELTIKNVKYVYIKRDGKPYLIKKMDTLKSISQSLYGTPDRWKDIWKNNPQLIKNPRKIYAGFTLYYPSDAKSGPNLKRIPTSSKESSSESINDESSGLPKELPAKVE